MGLPGTGLSWSVEHTASQGLPNSRRLRSGQLEALKQELLALLRQQLFAPGSTAARLWEHGSVSRLLADGSLGGHSRQPIQGNSFLLNKARSQPSWRVQSAW